jgi:class 3 adenylate cyclase
VAHIKRRRLKNGRAAYLAVAHSRRTGTGDGFLAIFDGPARAIRCACAVRDAAKQLGIDIRAGLHTGEIQHRERDIAGVAVNVGARVCAAAAPGEVLVSRTVVGLVAGSGIHFHNRGDHQLKGIRQPGNSLPSSVDRAVSAELGPAQHLPTHPNVLAGGLCSSRQAAG